MYRSNKQKAIIDRKENMLFGLKRIIPVILLFLISCQDYRTEYRLAAGPDGTSYHRVAENIKNIVSAQNGIKIRMLSQAVDLNGNLISLNSQNNCTLLMENEADFAISQNDVLLKSKPDLSENFQSSNIRSILPLYPEIFFLLYKKNLKAKSIKELISGREVVVGPRGSGTAHLTKYLFKEIGCDTTIYIPKYVDFEHCVLSDSIDICCLVTGFNNPRINKSLQNNGAIYSIGNYQNLNNGSMAEGFCLKYPLARPYVIPKNSFYNIPQEPILTIAIDAVLLTRADIKDHIIYNFLKTILMNKQSFVFDLDNILLSQITEKFDPLKLRFPLHPGAKQYLERNKPTFWERYAELAGFVFSILIAVAGGLSAFARWNKQRKKNRMDSYYHKIMVIQRQIKTYESIEKCDQSILRLRNIRDDAFKNLIKEKLRADESFRIFITFVNDTITEIQHRIDKLKN